MIKLRTTKRGVVRNIFSTWTSMAVNIVCGFVMYPFIVNTLGDAGNGVWRQVIAIGWILGVMEFGVSTHLARSVARYLAENRPQSVNRMVGGALALTFILGAACIGIAILTGFGYRFGVEEGDILLYSARAALVIFAVDLAAGHFIGNVFAGLLFGMQRHEAVYGRQILRAVGQLAVVLAVLKVRPFPTTIAASFLAVDLIYLALIGFAARSAFRVLDPLPGLFSWNAIRAAFRFGKYFFYGQLGTRIQESYAQILVACIFATSLVTYYDNAFRLIYYLKYLSVSMLTVLVPVAGELDAAQDAERLKRLFLTGGRMSLIITMPIALTYIFFGDALFQLWIGPQYGKSHGILIILVFPLLALASLQAGGQMSYGLGKHRKFTVSLLLTAAVGVSISAVLSSAFGLAGIALGSAAAEILLACFLTAHFTKMFNTSISDFLRAGWIPVLKSAIPYAVILWIARQYLVFHSLAFFLALSCIGGVLYLVLAYAFSMNDDDRSLLANLLR